MLLAIKVVLIIILTPLAGGLLAGFDRIISARLQGRKGPPLLQPFYDVLKLLQKETIEVNASHRFYVYVSLLFIVFTAIVMLLGGDILLTIFVLTLGSIFFVFGGYASQSPYSVIGAERELLQMMAYEPMVFMTAAGLYYVTNTFFIKDIISRDIPAVVYLPAIFLGFVYILTFKLRKSPFDLSVGHHAHQELVQGISTEYSGRALAAIEVTHWYESIIAMAFVYIFFAANSVISHVVAVIVCILVYWFEIIVDNSTVRVKWQMALTSAWVVSGVLGILNLAVLFFFEF
ncbi:respiratory chain complex I subunit 1 family protein [Faecalicatena contorta]|uniref:Ech hydrogenase subunit B n=1 Tax=Faecalicatena contorta TaxID=39482 RepID=A0A315ZU76_9FIRM|nr:complex I subunit 1 family protein [Faecalicatena contorta]PWJ48398.1 ech hydrogenase subunit B [Faecalicatena contorta]SUQ15421.1 ech hydrogenase subunit B [Faecalicatena contorta]